VSLAQPVQPSLPFSILVTQWTRILGEAQRVTQIPRPWFRELPSSDRPFVLSCRGLIVTLAIALDRFLRGYSEVSNWLSIASELRDAIEQRFCTGDIVIPLPRQVIASGGCVERIHLTPNECQTGPACPVLMYPLHDFTL